VSSRAIEPVHEAVSVRVPRQRAWEAFTAQMGRWWPLQTHSVLADQGGQGKHAARLVVEGRVGGEIYEQAGDQRAACATVLVWDPPCQLSVRWRVNPAALTEWTATFTPEGGGTRVDLVHGGWESHGDRAAEVRSGYGGDEGWRTVLRCLQRFLDG